MKTRLNYKSKKTIIITVAIIVLLALSTTGIYIFTKGNDQAEAFTESNTMVEGSSQIGSEGITNLDEEQTVEPNIGLENNGEEIENTPTTSENITEGETTTEQNNVVRPITTVTGNIPNTNYVTERQEEVRKLIYEGYLVGWAPISITGLTENMSLNKAEPQPSYTIEKVATLVNGETLTKNNNGEITTKVRLGDKVTYVITLKNTGNVTLQNIEVSDELIGYEKTIPVLAIGDKKELTVQYTVAKNDINQDEEIVNIVKATVTDPTNPEKQLEEDDEEIVPVNPTPVADDELVTKTAQEIDKGKYKIEIKVPGKGEAQRHDEVILMVDGSYSMDNEWPSMKAAIIEIGKAFLSGTGNTQLTLMAFGMGDNQVLTHVKTVSELEKSLGELPSTLLYGRSSTNCEAGFTGVAEYIDKHDDSLNDVHVVFISDGNINTDETPYVFYNWKQNTWLRWSPTIIANLTLSLECEHILAGGEASKAFKTIFGEDANAQTVMETATEEQIMAWSDLVWDSVYQYSNLVKDKAYPVSDVERAFVAYDKENNTYIQDTFYYALVGRKYPERWNRTPAAANALAAKEEVKTLYMVDYDNYTSWMDTGITAENSEFIKSDGINGLIKALQGVITDLSKTPFNDVVITDYMSKWVNLDQSSIAIVDDTTNKVIYTTQQGWLIEENKRPTSKEEPVKIELVPASEYVNGGEDVEGNTHGDIYKITWYVKEGSMLRSDSYHLEYIITVDNLESSFEYNTKYPANGNTFIEYEDENDNDKKEDIRVPNVQITE